MDLRRVYPWLLPGLYVVISGCGSPADRGSEPAAETGGSAPIELDTPLLPTVVVEGEPLPPSGERTLKRLMTDLGVPGVSIAVIRAGEIVQADGFGLADVESGRPVTPDTLFQAASISKPVAAMGALRLAQDGRVDLDADVNAALTSWKVPANELTHPADGEPRPVTLRDLLRHTAGLTVHGFPGYLRDEPIPSTIDVLDGKGNTDPIRVDMTPRTARRYSGGGYTVAQQLIVDVAGGETTFHALMRETVLAPLGMTDSTYEQPLPEALHERAATGYRPDGTSVEGRWHVYPEMAAAGLWTTPTDLARFVLTIQEGAKGKDGPVLTAATIGEMLTPPGLGLSLGEGRFGHGGSNAGFRCMLTAFIDGGDGAVVMTNSDTGSVLVERILMTLFEVYGWPEMEPVEKVVFDLQPGRLERYAGRYRIEGYGEVVISVSEPGERLRIELPDGRSAELRPESETEFFNTVDGQTVAFAVDRDGAVRGFRGPGFHARRVD